MSDGASIGRIVFTCILFGPLVGLYASAWGELVRSLFMYRNSGGGTRAQTAQQVIAGTEKTHSTNDGGASEKEEAACLHRLDINIGMLEAGYAWHYKHYDKSPGYAAAGSEARAAKRGLWSAPPPHQPLRLPQGETQREKREKLMFIMWD